MYQPIVVNYQATSSVYTANQWLHELSTKDIIAWDLEVAVKYTPEEIEKFKQELTEIETRLKANEYD